MRYKTGIIYISILVLFLTMCVGGMSIYQSMHKRIPYPGEGVYDLTTSFPCVLEGEVEKNIEILKYDFLTNSTEIKVLNEAHGNVTVYLYDTLDETNRAIGSFTLEPGQRRKFTNLTSSRSYRVGIESIEKKYAVTISD